MVIGGELTELVASGVDESPLGHDRREGAKNMADTQTAVTGEHSTDNASRNEGEL